MLKDIPKIKTPHGTEMINLRYEQKSSANRDRYELIKKVTLIPIPHPNRTNTPFTDFL